MNKTTKRKEYTLFTEPLIPIYCGIYSKKDNSIMSFKDIKGKEIGVERRTALAESFTNEYPNLPYTLKIHDTFEETRTAFDNGEVDGFLSTKSFDENVKGLNFFKIESITMDTNHVGVSKDYPILYSIIRKEVAYLKKNNWDVLVSDVINFELEKSLLDFSDKEKNYLTEKEYIVVGLPKEYFLYAYGEENHPKGIIPSLLKKIEFIGDVDFVYRFDSHKNLRLREDIDFYIDNYHSKKFSSNEIFNDRAIIVGDSKKNIINEIYELSTYRVGILGVPNVTDFLLDEMPNINLKEFTDLNLAIEEIDKEELDYLIVPKTYFNSSKHSNYITQRGEFKNTYNMFVSDDKDLIDILDKCQTIIDTKRIIAEETKSNIEEIKLSLYIFIILTILCILIILKKIYLKTIKVIYADNKYGLYNTRYLYKKIKNKDTCFILIKINNSNNIRYYYGEKIFQKYIKYFISTIEKNFKDLEYLVYRDIDKFLIVRNYGDDVMQFLDLLTKSVVIRDIPLDFDTSICYLEHFSQDNLETTFNKLNIGISISKEKNKAIYFNEAVANMYKSKIDREENIKDIINSGSVNIIYKDLTEKSGQSFGKYISLHVNNISEKILYKNARKLGLESKLDRIVIKKALNSKENNNIFINICEETLMASGFTKWLSEKTIGATSIYFIVTLDTYENCMDIFGDNKNVHFVIKSFGNNLMNDLNVKYIDAEYLIIDESLTCDLEEYREVINYIVDSAKENSKKIISFSPLLDGVDYYIGGLY